jgi:single-strand DNA-binding protein
MNVVVLSGHVSSEPVARELPSGEVVWSFDLAAELSEADPPTSVPVPVAWSGTGAEGWPKGTPLVIAGMVRRRFFRTGGTTQSRTEVVAEHIVAVTKRRSVERALAGVLAALRDEDRSKLRSLVG